MVTAKDELVLRNGVVLKNRMVMAPMTTKMSFFNGVVTTDEINYYRQRSGEVAAVITGAANVQEDGKGWDGELGIYDDKFIPGLSKLAAAIKQNGTKAIVQIFHAGRMTNSKILAGVQPVSPSAIPAERPNAEVPREFETEEIIALIANFSKATERAIKAGFDGVELHGANTYLIQQFFSPHSNRRTDEWGGTLEKRMAFISQLIDQVTQTARSLKEDFIVGYRFSPEEYEEPGIRFEDTLKLVDFLAEKDLDYLHISLNDYAKLSVNPNMQDKSMLAYVHDTIAGRVPLIGVGDVRTLVDANSVLEHAEIVALGRAIIAEPHWVNKSFNGQDQLIRTDISFYDWDDLYITEGLWSFLERMMPERLH